MGTYLHLKEKKVIAQYYMFWCNDSGPSSCIDIVSKNEIFQPVRLERMEINFGKTEK